MSDLASGQKTELRRLLRAEHLSHSSEERRQASAAMCASISGWNEWQRASLILGYHPLPDEPDLLPVLRQARAQGKTIALPSYDAVSGVYVAAEILDFDRDLVPGRFGVLEPRPGCPSVPINRLDFAFVPGVGFDLTGGRLGRGKGYYDRLLVDLNGLRCGAGFDWQVRVAVPMESHDIRVDFLVTQSRLVRLTSRGIELQ